MLDFHFDVSNLIYACLQLPVWGACWYHQAKWQRISKRVQKLDEDAPILLPVYQTLVIFEVVWVVMRFVLFGFLLPHMNFSDRSGKPVSSKSVFLAILYMTLADGMSVFILVLLFSFLISPSAGRFALHSSIRTATKYALLYIFSGTICITVLAPHYEQTYYIMQTLNPCMILFFLSSCLLYIYRIKSLRWKSWLYASLWTTFACWLLYTIACLIKVLDGSVLFMTASRYLIAFCYNFIIPILYYRSLIDDSRYWRNLEKFILPTQSFSMNSGLLKHNGLETFTVSGRGGHLRDALINFDIPLIDFTQLTTPSTILGRGGYGVVWKARYREELVAVKELHGERLSVDHIKLFFREAILSTKFEHNNILKFHGACIQPPEFLMVFQWCNRGDLGHYLRKSREKLTFQKRLEMAHGAVNGLQFFHQNGMVHRDLKPPNFLVHDEESGFTSIKLADFGSGRSKHDKMPLFQGISPLFAAPEIRSLIPMILKSKDSLEAAKHMHIMYGQEVDIFSLGWVLWAIFIEGDWKQILKNHNEQIFEGWLPKEMMSEWPEEVRQIISQCWETESSARPSIEDIFQTLDNLVFESREWWEKLEERHRTEITSMFIQGVEYYEGFHKEVKLDLRLKCGLTEQQVDAVPGIVKLLDKDSSIHNPDHNFISVPFQPSQQLASTFHLV